MPNFGLEVVSNAAESRSILSNDGRPNESSAGCQTIKNVAATTNKFRVIYRVQQFFLGIEKKTEQQQYESIRYMSFGIRVADVLRANCAEESCLVPVENVRVVQFFVKIFC